nr:PREDICTED: uncharacterized protein LOC103361720 [Stegastes partitus]
MANVRYFPSVDDLMESKAIWPFFDPQPHQIKFKSFSTKNFVAGADQHMSATEQVEPPAAWKTSSPVGVADYQPLKAFSVAAREDGGLTSWSEADDICELSIRMKEIELCNMMGVTPVVQRKGRRSCQGVKPKSPACSTPSVPESWVQAKSSKSWRSKEPPPPLSQDSLQLGKRFKALEKLMSPTSPPGSRQEASSSRRRLLKEAVDRHLVDAGLSADRTHPGTVRSAPGGSPQPARKAHHRQSSTGPAPQLPSVLIVGDSIIRDVRSSKAVTHCFPGAKRHHAAAAHLFRQVRL